jgi:predicted acyltransferase
MNIFPRENPFLFNGGGYSTLSFIPTLGTMLLGLLAGNILNSSITATKKLNSFAKYGVGLILLGALIHFAGINPIVKRIWTPAWTIFSGGICFLFLAMFYGLIDMKNRRKGTFFLMVIGVNSIAAYVIADGGMRNVINDSLFIHLGKNFDQMLGPTYATLISGGLVLFFEWLILYWMYKKKLFIKI